MQYFCLALLVAIRDVISAGAAPITWAIPTDPQAITVSLGEEVTFTWSGTHDVAESASFADFTNCVKANATERAPQSDGGSFTLNMSEVGTRYFICRVGDHCDRGQKIAITAEIATNDSPDGNNDPTSSMAYAIQRVYPMLAMLMLSFL